MASEDPLFQRGIRVAIVLNYIYTVELAYLVETGPRPILEVEISR
jgi:hypothetical protein